MKKVIESKLNKGYTDCLNSGGKISKPFPVNLVIVHQQASRQPNPTKLCKNLNKTNLPKVLFALDFSEGS